MRSKKVKVRARLHLVSSVVIISLNVCVIDQCFYFQVQRPLHQSSLWFRTPYLLFLTSWKTCLDKLQITPLHRLYSVRAVDLPLLVKSKLVCVVFFHRFSTNPWAYMYTSILFTEMAISTKGQRQEHSSCHCFDMRILTFPSFIFSVWILHCLLMMRALVRSWKIIYLRKI